MSRIQMVMFDFDGTLVDTAPDLISATNLFLQSKGVAPMSDAAIRREIGVGLTRFLMDIYPDHNDEADKRKLLEAEFISLYEQEFLKTPRLFDGAYEFLHEWEGQLAIVSNKRARFIAPILKQLGLADLKWTAIIGGDTFPHMKPHPEPFLAAMSKAGLTPEECLMVGDGSPDIVGSLAVGCTSVAVDFGYSTLEELVDLGAHYQIRGFDELMPLIRTLT